MSEPTILQIIMGLLTLACTMLGVMLNRQDRRIEKLEDKHGQLVIDLPQNYLAKSEHRRAMDILNENQATAYTKLEKSQEALRSDIKDQFKEISVMHMRLYDELKTKVDK